MLYEKKIIMIASIVIPTHERYNELRNCLLSFRNLKYNNKYEIIVIANGNKDDKAVKLVLGDFKDLPIRSFFYPQKLGAAGAKNKGIEKARGEVIVFIDDDVVVEPNWLSELMRCYKDKDIAAVGGSEIKPYSTGIMRKIWFKMRRNVTGKILSSGEVISNFSPYKKQVEGVDCLPGANMSIRADVLKRIGGYDEFYGGNGYREETDFGPRIKKLGMKILFNPKASLYHKESNAGGNVSAMDIKKWCYWYYRNHTYFYMKNLYQGKKLEWQRFVLRQYNDVLLRSLMFRSFAPITQLSAIKEGKSGWNARMSVKKS